LKRKKKKEAGHVYLLHIAIYLKIPNTNNEYPCDHFHLVMG